MVSNAKQSIRVIINGIHFYTSRHKIEHDLVSDNTEQSIALKAVLRKLLPRARLPDADRCVGLCTTERGYQIQMDLLGRKS